LLPSQTSAKASPPSPLDRRQHRGRGNRGIDGIAAFPQHPQAGLRGQRMRRRNDIAREHRQALRRIWVLPVETCHVKLKRVKVLKEASGAADVMDREPRTLRFAWIERIAQTIAEQIET
jgi:hypothetical protein